MCGRYTNQTPLQAFAELFGTPVPDLELGPRYNVAPGDAILACRASPVGGRELVLLRWGFVPAWSRTPSAGPRPINARAESVGEKPLFRDAFRRRRCLVAADGFYEWKPEGKRKQPWYFRLAGGVPFAFAGIWERTRGPEGEPLETCAILVTEANELVARIHARMPVILTGECFGEWLDTAEGDAGRLSPLLRPFPPGRMEAFPVGPAVNRPGVEGPDLLRPLETAGGTTR